MATVKNIFVGDIGTVFEATIKENGVVVDVSTATTKELLFLRPDDSTITATAQFTTDGTDGKIQYTTQAGDITIPGVWKWQGKITFATGGPFHTSIKSFRAAEVIA